MRYTIGLADYTYLYDAQGVGVNGYIWRAVKSGGVYSLRFGELFTVSTHEQTMHEKVYI